jgi:hypothetical protein
MGAPMNLNKRDLHLGQRTPADRSDIVMAQIEAKGRSSVRGESGEHMLGRVLR